MILKDVSDVQLAVRIGVSRDCVIGLIMWEINTPCHVTRMELEAGTESQVGCMLCSYLQR